MGPVARQFDDSESNLDRWIRRLTVRLWKPRQQMKVCGKWAPLSHIWFMGWFPIDPLRV